MKLKYSHSYSNPKPAYLTCLFRSMLIHILINIFKLLLKAWIVMNNNVILALKYKRILQVDGRDIIIFSTR